MPPTQDHRPGPDGRPMWSIIVDHIQVNNLGPGDLLTYDKLEALLGRTPAERGSIQNAVRTASAHLLKIRKRFLRPVINQGYRIAHSWEHAGIGEDKELRSRRQMQRAVDVYQGTRLEDLNPAQRAHHTQKSMMAQATLAALNSRRCVTARRDELITSVTLAPVTASIAVAS